MRLVVTYNVTVSLKEYLYTDLEYLQTRVPIYEILHLATLGVKPLGAHIRGAIYVVLPSIYSCHLCTLAIYVLLPLTRPPRAIY